MTLKTWSFSKKHNSTAQPVGSSRDYTVYLKENTSIEAPVFILGSGIDAGISYAQAFGNYYFVDDIVMISKDQVELHCSIDVLATHKTAIGNYSAFIERSASAHNAYLNDPLLSATQDIIASAVSTQALWNIDQVGCYIVRVVGEGEAPTGITSYVLSPSELSSLISDLFDDTDYTSELTDAVAKTFFNPFQYIVSVMWFPMSKSDIAGESHTLHLGWWTKGSYKRITSYFYFNTYDLTKPTNYYVNDFRAYHPDYTSFCAYIPGVGKVDLDPLILSHEKLNISCSIDWVTGNMQCRLRYMDSSDNIKGDIASYSGQVGVPVPVGQINGIAEGMASQGISAMAIGGVSQFLMNELAGQSQVQAFRNTLSPTPSMLGNAGNRANITSNPRMMLSIVNYGCAEFPNVHYGRPLCSVRTLSTLSGFIKCNAASISLAAPDTEIDKVNNYLNSGFYYE